MPEPESDGRSPRALVALSGGPHSAVAAALLKIQGFDVQGVHFRLHDEPAKEIAPFEARCRDPGGLAGSERASRKLEIPLHVVEAREDFREWVVDRTLHEIVQGRAALPCLYCNEGIKFRLLGQKADQLGIPTIATGHFARIHRDVGSGRIQLLKASDPAMDESYYLYGIRPALLARIELPLGGLSELMVRKLAIEMGMETEESLDELGTRARAKELCFVGSGRLPELVDRLVAASFRPGGMIRTVAGDVVGDHKGLHRHPIGQQKGILYKTRPPQGVEWRVVGHDADTHSLVVGTQADLLHRSLLAQDARWIRAPSRVRGLRCQARTEPSQEERDCLVSRTATDELYVEFREPHPGIAPGRAVVFYDSGEVIGGALIASVDPRPLRTEGPLVGTGLGGPAATSSKKKRK